MSEIQSLAHSATYIILLNRSTQSQTLFVSAIPILKYEIEFSFLVYNVIIHLYFINKILGIYD